MNPKFFNYQRSAQFFRYLSFNLEIYHLPALLFVKYFTRFRDLCCLITFVADAFLISPTSLITRAAITVADLMSFVFFTHFPPPCICFLFVISLVSWSSACSYSGFLWHHEKTVILSLHLLPLWSRSK